MRRASGLQARRRDHRPGARARGLRRVVAGAAALALLVGCGDDAPEHAVEVSGVFGSAPTLVYEKPLVIDAASARVIWEGDGVAATEGSTILLNLYGQDATDGSQIVNTHHELPRAYTVTADSLGGALHAAILGHRAGSRILVEEVSDGVPVVLVADTIAGRAQGDPVEAPKDLPAVVLDEAGAPTVTVPDTPAPAGVVVQPLVRGRGNQVAPGQTVVVQYTAVSWSTGAVIDSSWTQARTPFTTIVGDSRPVAAWDEGLIEQTVGSQVLIVAPPASAYGGTTSEWAQDTIVFVVDILFAGTLAAPQDAGTPGSDEGPGDEPGDSGSGDE